MIYNSSCFMTSGLIHPHNSDLDFELNAEVFEAFEFSRRLVCLLLWVCPSNLLMFEREWKPVCQVCLLEQDSSSVLSELRAGKVVGDDPTLDGNLMSYRHACERSYTKTSED